MAEEMRAGATQEDLSEILQVRRDKLRNLQEEGRDPFTVTKFLALPGPVRLKRTTISTRIRLYLSPAV